MSPAPRRPSMGDVAARAGVSYQTVSRVLNEPGIVRPRTRDRVLAAIAELGYTRNRAARTLKTSRSSLIGVLTDGSSLFGPAETTTAIEAAAREAGYSVLLTTVGTEDADRAVGAELLGSGVDGILVVAAHEGMTAAVAAAARSTPVLAISARPPATPGVAAVGVDQELGAREVVDHLARTGIRTVVHLAGPSDWFDAIARREGFEQALAARGMDGEVRGPGDWSPRSGSEMTEALIRSGLPEAIFAANDMMAIGVLNALHRHGIRVPEDVSVVGFDNTLGAEFLIPSLTTVSQPFAELGRSALAHLLSLLEGHEAPPAPPLALPPRLVVRRTTRPERTH